jgi:membrane-associated protease RseP (regulator of RpoE activity)
MEYAETGEGLKFRHYLLFFLTLLATTVTGISLHPDGSDLSEGLLLIQRSPFFLLEGLPFSISLLLIVALHEYGHLAAGRKHRISVTMPYFIPAPPYITLGTFGAFIKIKSPIPTRSSLIEMGAFGPVYGFIASIAVLTFGYLSYILGYHVPTDFGFNTRYPLAFAVIKSFFTGHLEFEGMLFENPIIAGAWIGFFIQGLNLLPVGQLDGGHIVYGLFRFKHKNISRFIAFFFIALTPFGFHFLIWALLFFVLGFNHPPTVHDEQPLETKDRLLAFSGLLIFLLSFQPLPFVT